MQSEITNNNITCGCFITLCGFFELIIGPMYAGKSTALLRHIDKFKYLGKVILVINHAFNNRYNSINVSTHNGYTYDDCIVINNLQDIFENEEYLEKFKRAEVIIIDELQFFKDALKYIPEWCDNDKKYIVACGLSGNAKREPMGDVLNLIPHADKVHTLAALCSECCDGTPAIFSKKIVNNNDNILVGSTDIYAAVCRKHYLE